MKNNVQLMIMMNYIINSSKNREMTLQLKNHKEFENKFVDDLEKKDIYLSVANDYSNDRYTEESLVRKMIEHIENNNSIQVTDEQLKLIQHMVVGTGNVNLMIKFADAKDKLSIVHENAIIKDFNVVSDEMFKNNSTNYLNINLNGLMMLLNNGFNNSIDFDNNEYHPLLDLKVKLDYLNKSNYFEKITTFFYKVDSEDKKNHNHVDLNIFFNKYVKDNGNYLYKNNPLVKNHFPNLDFKKITLSKKIDYNCLLKHAKKDNKSKENILHDIIFCKKKDRHENVITSNNLNKSQIINTLNNFNLDLNDIVLDELFNFIKSDVKEIIKNDVDIINLKNTTLIFDTYIQESENSKKDFDGFYNTIQLISELTNCNKSSEIKLGRNIINILKNNKSLVNLISLLNPNPEILSSILEESLLNSKNNLEKLIEFFHINHNSDVDIRKNRALMVDKLVDYTSDFFIAKNILDFMTRNKSEIITYATLKGNDYNYIEAKINDIKNIFFPDFTMDNFTKIPSLILNEHLIDFEPYYNEDVLAGIKKNSKSFIESESHPMFFAKFSYGIRSKNFQENDPKVIDYVIYNTVKSTNNDVQHISNIIKLEMHESIENIHNNYDKHSLKVTERRIAHIIDQNKDNIKDVNFDENFL